MKGSSLLFSFLFKFKFRKRNGLKSKHPIQSAPGSATIYISGASLSHIESIRAGTHPRMKSIPAMRREI